VGKQAVKPAVNALPHFKLAVPQQLLLYFCEVFEEIGDMKILRVHAKWHYTFR
jgi:hypothetical protein